MCNLLRLLHILIKSQAHSNFTQNNIELLERRGGEMADTPALEAGGSNPVGVQVLPSGNVFFFFLLDLL